METYVKTGSVQIIPVHAAVITLGFSTLPDDISAGGTGAKSVPAGHVIFAIYFLQIFHLVSLYI